MDLNKIKDKKYKLGLSLSGGGARGYAHIGVIKALEEWGIVPDLVAGVSAGSIVAAFYCSGFSSEQILDVFKGEHFRDFVEITIPRESLFNMDGLRDFLERIFEDKDLSDLPIPLQIIATDFDHGLSKCFQKGCLSRIICASCSIPIIFPPVIINGIRYVDGGVLRNFPVRPIRSLCEKIIGVNVNPLELTHYKKNIINIAERAYTLMYRSNSEADAQLCDILIEPKEAIEYAIFDLKHLKDLVDAGYQETCKILENQNIFTKKEYKII